MKNKNTRKQKSVMRNNVGAVCTTQTHTVTVPADYDASIMPELTQLTKVLDTARALSKDEINWELLDTLVNANQEDGE